MGVAKQGSGPISAWAKTGRVRLKAFVRYSSHEKRGAGMQNRFKAGQGVFVDDGLGKTLHGYVVETVGLRVGVQIGTEGTDEVRYFVHRGLYPDSKSGLEETSKRPSHSRPWIVAMFVAGIAGIVLGNFVISMGDSGLAFFVGAFVAFCTTVLSIGTSNLFNSEAEKDRDYSAIFGRFMAVLSMGSLLFTFVVGIPDAVSAFF